MVSKSKKKLSEKEIQDKLSQLLIDLSDPFFVLNHGNELRKKIDTLITEKEEDDRV